MNSTFKFSFTKSDLDKIYWRFTSNDTRYEVKENSKIPYSAIGLLKIEYCNEVTSYRTGFLIGENVILTAGHNVYDARKNPKKPTEILGEPTKIEFYPGLNRNESCYNVTDKIQKIMFPSDFNTKPNEDYGIIVLSEKIGKELGFFNLKIFDETLIDEDFFIAGYPLNRSEDNNETFVLYEAKGKITNITKDKGIIIHSIKSSYGQSGSPLCYYDKNNNTYNVIGIQVASNAMNDDEFYATMITKKRYNQIQKWLKE